MICILSWWNGTGQLYYVSNPQFNAEVLFNVVTVQTSFQLMCSLLSYLTCGVVPPIPPHAECRPLLCMWWGGCLICGSFCTSWIFSCMLQLTRPLIPVLSQNENWESWFLSSNNTPTGVFKFVRTSSFYLLQSFCLYFRTADAVLLSVS